MNSVLEIIHQQIVAFPQKPALHYLDDKKYHPITYADMAGRAQALSGYFQQVLTEEFDQYLQDSRTNHSHHEQPVVVILANNCWQWAVSDLAIQLMGGISVPVYPTIADDQLAFILSDASPDIVIVDRLSLKRFNQLVDVVPNLKKVLVFHSVDDSLESDSIRRLDDVFDELDGALPLDSALWTQNRRPDIFTILYTSGTTGEPKSVPLTHENVVENFLGIQALMPITSADSSLSFLPLSHIFERVVGFVCVLGVGADIYYAESIETVSRDLLVARPTFLISVPRLYEKIYQRVLDNARGLKKPILKMALLLARFASKKGWIWRVCYMVVFKKIHQKTGGRVRFLVSGGAPLQRSVERFFNTINLPIIQGYGLTETSPIVSVNLDQRIGSVGKPIDNVSVRIAEDGEICVKGLSVFSGYGNTVSDGVFTDDGYFKTGDVGRLDKNGYLFITDRKKNIIVLSNGKNVSPQRVEEKLLQSPYIHQAMVIGDGFNYLVALVVPSVEGVCRELRLKEQSLADLVTVPRVMALITAEVQQLSRSLASFETVKRVVLIPREFSIESNELTPTLKMRRKEIYKQYESVILSVYDRPKKEGS